MEALGATVDHYSLELQCSGGAGGFHGSSRKEEGTFVKDTFDAIQKEAKADRMVVSYITCLMHLDNIQKELSNGNGNGTYCLPVFD